MTPCSLEKCQRNAFARGWCKLHYARWYQHGDPATTLMPWKGYRGPCSVDGCVRPHKTNGFCGTHYERWRKNGTTDVRMRPRGTGSIEKGYIRIRKGAAPKKAVHRLVMEKMLGRPLTADEVVHHINHDRADNRPENLQLMTHHTHGVLTARERGFSTTAD